jgi:hypothetical protein
MACTEVITQSTGIATVEEWAKLALNAPNSHVSRLRTANRSNGA